MDMRSKAYPALPEGRRLRLVLPRAGDLRFRPQIPAAFAQRLYIHADPRRRFWYARFELRRKFIVMSTQGDLYAKSCVTTFTMADLPKQNVLSMPRVTRGDLVKVLDLVQCCRSEGQRWELVFTRWRNGMETWLPLEVVQLFAPNLLQEFYVNSINSWAFHGRVQQENLSTFRTEVELWLFHPEFQELYKRLRQKRAGGSTASQRAASAPDRVHVKPEQSTAPAITSHTPPAHLTQALPPPVSVAAPDPSEAVIQEFEQRRLARELQEQLDQSRRNQLIQLQQQQQQQRAEEQAEEHRRLERERREQEQRVLEQAREQRRQQEQRMLEQARARRLQHERQRQKAHEDLQRSQKEYQQRLRAQQEGEKIAEIRRHEQEKQQLANGQERLRQRLQQDKRQNGQSQQKQSPINRRPQETTTRPPLRHKERQKKSSISNSSSQRPKEHNSSSVWTKRTDDEYIPPEGSESEDSDSTAESEASEDSLSNQPAQKRRRKRLLYSQVEPNDDDDDGDDLPDLSQPPPSTRRRSIPQEDSDDGIPVRNSTQTSKKRKRLRRPDLPKENGGSSSNIDLTQLSDDEDDSSLEVLTDTVVETLNDPTKRRSKDSSDTKAISELLDLVDDDGDADAENDMDFKPSLIIGEIRCVCGVTTVGGYRGQWLQCWKEDCGVWEHADCVGVLTSFEKHPPPKYLCTRCDPEAYLARCVNASHRILDWLFQCCDSRNLKQVMELLEDKTGAANLPSDWKNANFENRTLAMHAARNGLVKCLRYLLDERKVDVYATDLQGRNALHHAALGGSIACCLELLKRDRKLLLRQDLRGCMPLHCMLQSAKVNRLCFPFMREDAALVGMGDLDSNFPIHYACQAANNHTVQICQLIFAAQPSMIQKSSDGLYPLMILCKSAGAASGIRNRTANVSEACNSAKGVIALMLDIDVFGDCLNQTAPNGWIPLHFAAASGNHELVTHLCNIGLFDVHHAAKESEQTALHVAAQGNHPLCVRALLLEGLSVVAKDTNGWIPMLCTEDVACIGELMHYKLTKQLSRLHRMLDKYQQRGLVRRWQRCVARDPTCFDILNDWCQRDTERIERMEGLLLSSPYLLRLDNKIEYLRTFIIPCIKNTNGQCSITAEKPGQKKLAFVFSRRRGCFWKQFVGMGMGLEAEDFRLPIVFSIEQGGANSQATENRDKLVLIRLAAGLFKEVPSLLLRGSSGDLEKCPLSFDKRELTEQLLGFFMLGELVAHFVLFSVPLSGILDFTPAFLRCIGCKGKERMASDEPWTTAGRSFAAGFEAVLPATLELFHADELRVLFNGPETNLNALHIDWNTAVHWNMCDEDVGNAKTWLIRLMNELVDEEQQLVLLFMTGTFQLVNERFFRSEGGSGSITVESYPETESVLDHDMMYPTMEHEPDILRLPSYSCYDAFKKGVLGVIRHTDQAYRPE